MPEVPKQTPDMQFNEEDVEEPSPKKGKVISLQYKILSSNYLKNIFLL